MTHTSYPLFLQTQMTGLLNEMLSNLAGALPKVLGTIVVFIVGMIIARVVSKVVLRLLRASGVDKLAEKLNDIDIIQKSNVHLVPSVVVSRILYYLMMLIVILLATDILGMPMVSQLMTDLLNYIPQLLVAGIVFIAGTLLSDMLKNLVLTTCQSLGIPAAKLIANFVFYFLFMAVAVRAFSQAGVDTNFITSNVSILLAGVVLAFAIGYGLASRTMVANFLASYYSRDRVRIGDTISIEGVKGTVVDMDGSSLTLIAGDRRVLIPLSKLASEKIEIFPSRPEATPTLPEGRA